MRDWIRSVALLLLPVPLVACSALGKDTAMKLYPAEPGAEFDGRFEMSNIVVNVDPPKDGNRHLLFDCRGDVDVWVFGLNVNWQGNRDLRSAVASREGLMILPAKRPLPRAAPKPAGRS